MIKNLILTQINLSDVNKEKFKYRKKLNTLVKKTLNVCLIKKGEKEWEYLKIGIIFYIL